MRYQDLLLPLSLLLLITILAAGCRSPDCEWEARVKAWIDMNEDGRWDDAELPLPDVTTFVEGAYTVGIGEASTNEEGEAHLSTMLAGCPKDIVLSVGAEPPSGYRLTTQARLPARETDEGPFLFGFAPESE
jgi:protocatechuate 3,4-dioxygenase beta subunit